MNFAHRVGRTLISVVLSTPLVVLAAGPAEADFNLAVTWPAATTINPSTATYTIEISDVGGPGDLMAEWQGEQQTIPHAGTHNFFFNTDGTGVITVLRCNPGCVPAGVESPTLKVFRALQVTPSGTWGPLPVGGSADLAVQVVPDLGGASATVDWSLRDSVAPGANELTTGTSTSTQLANGDVPFSISLPPELLEGNYGLMVAVQANVPGLGVVSGTLSEPVPLIINNPPTVTMETTEALFYPVADNYLDTLHYRFQVSEQATGIVRVVDETGHTVRSLGSTAVDAGAWNSGVWNGRNNSGVYVSAGTYRVVARGIDGAGNSVEANQAVEVSRAKFKMLTSTKTYTAKRTLNDKFVGSCSSLVSPSSHGWSGSLGYYSQSRCTRTANNASVVIGAHAWWIPEAFNGKYGKLKISAYGGGARGTRSAYAVLGYIRASDNEFLNRVQFPAGLGWHAGQSASAAPFVRTAAGRPFVVWNLGLSEGSRYDVKSFKLQVDYQALVDTDGTVLLPRASRSASALRMAAPDPAQWLTPCPAPSRSVIHRNCRSVSSAGR
jgi:hypothetical protein